jgi:hypothetical protein
MTEERRGPQLRGIKEWARVGEEPIASAKWEMSIDGKQVTMAATLEIKNPVFHDGNKGRPVIELTLQKDRWSFRFRIPRQGMSEADGAIDVLQGVMAAKEKAYEAYDTALKTYEEEREKDRVARIAEHEKRTEQFKGGRGNDKAGGGLGKYSKPGKTKRHRERGKDERAPR